MVVINIVILLSTVIFIIEVIYDMCIKYMYIYRQVSPVGPAPTTSSFST